jgi:hypothetical protein
MKIKCILFPAPKHRGREEEFERSEVGGREVLTRMRAGATVTEEVKPAEKCDHHNWGKTKREKHEEDKDGKGTCSCI